MKNKVLISAFALLAMLLSLCCNSEPVLGPQSEVTFDGKSLTEYASVTDIPEIQGKHAYAINLETGTVVYTKDAYTKAFPANTTKLMTAIVAYENIPDLDVMITADQSVVSKAQGVNMSIKAGEAFTARELFYGLLVRGANDAALVLADYVAGSEETFCVLMNEKAKQLGAKDTHFDNVTGFYSEGSYTTARDMGIISQYMYYIPTLFDMSNTTRYVINPTEQTPEQRALINRNMLLSKVFSTDYYYGSAKGMTQGSTAEAGHCIVSTVTNKKGISYLCVVLNSVEKNDVNYACKDIAAIFDFCEKAFEFTGIVSVKDVICEIPVKNSNDVDHLSLFPEREIEVLLPTDADLENDITLEKRIEHDFADSPVNKGDVFGKIEIRYKNNHVIGYVNLVSNVAIDRSNVLYFFSSIEKIVTGTWFKVFAITALLLFMVYFGLSVYYRYFRCNKYTGSRSHNRTRRK